jgi:chromosome segregation ATPase
MSQIKQISKIVNNTSKETESINLPRYVIGILCNHDPNSGAREMEKLNIPYFNDEKKTFLKHTIDVIEKNNINVVICVIKEKIKGYPLGVIDYEIEDEKLKYRVDLPYMYKKIAEKDIDPERLEKLKDELKRYRSINSQKIHYIELTDEEYHTFQNLKEDEKSTNSFSLENANKKISELVNKNKVLENEKKEFENKNKVLENEKKELENEKKEFENKNKVLENEKKELENKIVELMKKLNKYESKEKQYQQNQQNQQNREKNNQLEQQKQKSRQESNQPE